MRLRLDTTARRHRRGRPQAPGRAPPTGGEELLAYDELVVGTGAVPVRPPIDGLPARRARPRRRRAPAALHGRHLRPHAHPRASRTGQRAHRRRRLRRPGDGRRADHPRHARHPDRDSCPRCCPPSTRSSAPSSTPSSTGHGVEVLTGTTVTGHQHRTARRTGRLQVAGRRSRRHGRGPARRPGPGRGRRPARHRPWPPRRGHARRHAARSRSTGDAHRPARRLRRRRLRRSPTTGCSAQTYLPLGTTAHKQGRVAGENALGGNRQFAGSLGTQVVEDLRPGRRPHRPARPRSHRRRVRPGHHRSPPPTTTRPTTPAATASPSASPATAATGRLLGPAAGRRTRTPRSPSASTSPPPPSSTA